MSDDDLYAAETFWVEVGRFRGRNDASEHALVLIAAGIECQMASRGWGVALLVAPWHAERARQELAAYADDNRPDPSLPIRRQPVGDCITGVLAYWCVLVVTYFAAGHNAFGFDWLAAGEGQAGLIQAGEWWRTVTALGLHGDLGHIASNLVAGSLFGFFLAEMIGSGPAWLLILVSGAAGNLVNSLLQPASHTSIGASTAIFGAVGLLAVLAIRYRQRRLKRGLRRWAPIAAGIMLLAFLGTEGDRIDVGAHFAGFAAGCAIGAAVLLLGHPAATRRGTVLSTAAALLVYGVAWTIALIHGGG